MSLEISGISRFTYWWHPISILLQATDCKPMFRSNLETSSTCSMSQILEKQQQKSWNTALWSQCNLRTPTIKVCITKSCCNKKLVEWGERQPKERGRFWRHTCSLAPTGVDKVCVFPYHKVWSFPEGQSFSSDFQVLVRSSSHEGLLNYILLSIAVTRIQNLSLLSACEEISEES